MLIVIYINKFQGFIKRFYTPDSPIKNPTLSKGSESFVDQFILIDEKVRPDFMSLTNGVAKE